jgi:hypothetical protein
MHSQPDWFILHAKKQGTDFTNTAVIGTQIFTIGPELL